MGEYTIFERFKSWLVMRPIRLAYRLVWLAALTGHETPRCVYRAMWLANIDLPEIKGLCNG